MLHQTPTTSSSFLPPSTATTTTTSASSSSPFILPLCLVQPPRPTTPHSHSSQGVKDTWMMDTAPETTRRPEAAGLPQQTHLAEELASVMEGGILSGDASAFSVEDLLDLEEFAEPEKEAEQSWAEASEEEPTENPDSPSALFSGMPPPPAVVDLPVHDAEELEWVSLFTDDSLTELPSPRATYHPPALAAPHPQARTRGSESHHKFRPPGPGVCAVSTEALVPVKARRSKRSRAAVWSLSGSAPFSDSSSSSTATTATSSCCSSSSPFLLYDAPILGAVEQSLLFDDNPPAAKKPRPKKRGRKPKHPPQGATSTAASGSGGERRCSHCGVQKTPQWRAGPEGAKTLCNACGVRYKSGRLLPEYRPACSPTFITDIHSNSHRRVIEMRRKKEATLLSAAAPPVASF